MKFCLVCNEYPPATHGGIGPVTQHLATGLAELGHEVNVVGIYDQTVDSSEESGLVMVHRLAKVGHGILGELQSRFKLTRYIGSLHRQKEFDLIEAPEWRGDTAWLRINAPVVLRLHTSHVVDRKMTKASPPSRLVGYFENLALKRATAVCAVSADIARKTAQAFPCFEQRLRFEKVPVVHNAIEVEMFRPGSEPRQPAMLCFAGSLKPVKGVENLLKAFERVLNASNCCLVLAGSDTRTASGDSYLEACFEKVPVKVRAHVEVLGRLSREQVAALFRRAAVVVLPSLQEACPMVVMEAMASGAPTIFGACGPHSEIIENGVDGLVCDPHSPDDIAEKILCLLSDQEKALALGRAARLRAERNFTIERFLQGTLDFYSEAIARYHGREE